MTFIATVVALLGALCYAVALVVQQKTASEVPAESAHGIGLILRLIRRPMWWAGIMSNAGGFMLRIAALAFGPVLLVQPLLLMALVFALPLSSKWHGRKISRSEVIWAVVLAGALATFVIICSPAGGGNTGSSRWPIALAIILGLEAINFLVSRTLQSKGGPTGQAWPRLLRAGIIAFGAGLLFGVTAALGRPVSDIFSHRGESSSGFLDLIGSIAVNLITSWEPYVLVIAAVLATVVLQTAFHSAPLTASLPTMKVTELLTATSLAMLVLGETITVEGIGWVALALSAIAIPTATVALSRLSAVSEKSSTTADSIQVTERIA